MGHIEYSAVIRAIGYGPYIERLLQNLTTQSLPPSEIIIVLPHGVPLWQSPQEIRFAYSPKGMISQRAEGIKIARYPYVLLLDDDIIFQDELAAEKLFTEMLKHNAVLAIPYSPEAAPQGIIRKFVYALFGIAIPTSKRHLGYAATGGFFYPRNPSFDKPYTTEGGRGACVAADRNFLMKYSIFGDSDLEKIPYALRDDAALVLNVVLHGGKAVLVGGVSYTHLGGDRRLTPSRLYWSWVAMIYNHWIFWRKYIRRRYRFPVIPIVALSWYVIGVCLLAFLSALNHKNVKPIVGVIQGLKMTVQERINKVC